MLLKLPRRQSSADGGRAEYCPVGQCECSPLNIGVSKGIIWMRISEVTQRPMPTRSFAQLFHVGTLNLTDKGTDSHEGSGLSVSLHPEEWMDIAEIGGDIWRATKAGNRFLNFHRLSKTHRQIIHAWGEAHGYVTRQSLWRVNFYDEELEQENHVIFDNEEDAWEEADEMGTEPIEVRNSFVGTTKLWQRSRHSRAYPGFEFDLLCPIYAEDELNIDGVWWQDILDVARLSAPRGVIVPSKVASWTFTRISSRT